MTAETKSNIDLLSGILKLTNGDGAEQTLA